MTLELKPKRGGFLYRFGCGWFIREYLMGNEPYCSPGADPGIGAPQADMFYHYKQAPHQPTALDRATRTEERKARNEKRVIDPDNIESLAKRYLARITYKTIGCRYHSFVTYFSTLQRLGWVEPSGIEEPSAFQGNYPAGQPRKYYRLTPAGIAASDLDWRNPQVTLYGR